MKAVLPALARPLVEPHVPAGIDVSWYTSFDVALALAPQADIGWFDHNDPRLWAQAVGLASNLRWLSTIYAGLDKLDIATLKARGVRVTNGSGINAVAVAEYAVMGTLIAAKRFDQVVRMADRHEWPGDSPGKAELYDSSALIIGYGTIGRLIGERLAAFGVKVTPVTRSGAAGSLLPDQWRVRLGAFDWIVLAAPSTPETDGMIGAAELAAMKSTAWIVNVGRGALIDQAALVDALNGGDIGGAFLDTVTPEPLPPADPLWSAKNAIHSMHLSGRSQTLMFRRAAELFVRNLHAWKDGRPLENEVDLDAGY